MYSERLETLIDSIIAKGTITQEDRNLLYDKAKEWWSKNVSKNEIDFYVDKRLKFEFNHKHDPQVFVKVLIGLISKSPQFQYCIPFKADTLPANSVINDLVIIFLEHADSDNMELLFAYDAKNADSHSYSRLSTLRIDTNQGLCISNVSDVEYGYSKNIGRMFHNYSLQINEKILRILCDSSEFTVTMRGGCKTKDGDYTEFDLQFPLKHFQFYLQSIYNALFDNEVYPNIKEKMAEAEKAEEQRIAKEKTENEQRIAKEKTEKEEKKAAEAERRSREQQVTGILSRKIGGNRILSPYYMSQYKVLDFVVTDVAGKIVTRDKNSRYKPNLYLHAIMTEDNEAMFYLCMTTSWRKEIKGTIVLSINLKDHTLFPVTDNESFLSDKSLHKETDNEYYNFFYIDRDLLNAFLKAKGLTLKIIDDRGEEKEYKIRSVPGNWKKAFKFLSSKDGQKKWEEQVGGFSKYFQTLLSIIESAIGIKKLLLILLAIIILYIIIF